MGEESKGIGLENADVNGTETSTTRLHLDHLLAGADGSKTVHVWCSLPYSPAHPCHKRAQTCEALAVCPMAQEHGIAATATQHHKGRSTASRLGAFGAPGGSSPLCNPWPTDLRLRVARGKHLDWSFPEEAEDFAVEVWAVNHLKRLLQRLPCIDPWPESDLLRTRGIPPSLVCRPLPTLWRVDLHHVFALA